MATEQEPVLLLHLSDLHFGEHSRFHGLDPRDIAERFKSAIGERIISEKIPCPVNLVIVTGDISEKGLPSEYDVARLFFEKLANELSLDRRRFLFVPGNHDVSWIECRRALLDLEEGNLGSGHLRELVDARKFSPFNKFVEEFVGTPRKDLAVPLARGAFVYDLREIGLSVACLNSCERESDQPADHHGLIGREQTQQVMDYWKKAGSWSTLRILAVHHNPTATVPEVAQSWLDFLKLKVKEHEIDTATIERFAGDVVGFDGRELLEAIAEDSQVQLILHGHHHASAIASVPWRGGAKGATQVLSAGSWGLVPDKLPKDQPNTCQLVLLDPGKHELKAWRMRYEPGARPVGKVSPGTFAIDPAAPRAFCQDLPVVRTSHVEEPKAGSSEVLSPVHKTRPMRRRMPTTRQSITHRFDIGGYPGTIVVGLYDDGTPGELLIDLEKKDSTTAGLLDAVSVLFSLSLQYGVPLRELIERFSKTGFGPSGYTKNPDIPITRSIMDYCARWLGHTFLEGFKVPPPKL